MVVSLWLDYVKSFQHWEALRKAQRRALHILTGNVPLTRLGRPLGYGFPGIIPQEEIMATGALQPTLHTYWDRSRIILEIIRVCVCYYNY